MHSYKKLEFNSDWPATDGLERWDCFSSTWHHLERIPNCIAWPNQRYIFFTWLVPTNAAKKTKFLYSDSLFHGILSLHENLAENSQRLMSARVVSTKTRQIVRAAAAGAATWKLSLSDEADKQQTPMTTLIKRLTRSLLIAADEMEQIRLLTIQNCKTIRVSRSRNSFTLTTTFVIKSSARLKATCFASVRHVEDKFFGSLKSLTSEDKKSKASAAAAVSAPAPLCQANYSHCVARQIFLVHCLFARFLVAKQPSRVCVYEKFCFIKSENIFFSFFFSHQTQKANEKIWIIKMNFFFNPRLLVMAMSLSSQRTSSSVRFESIEVAKLHRQADHTNVDWATHLAMTSLQSRSLANLHLASSSGLQNAFCSLF